MRLLAELREHGVALHGGVSDIAISDAAVSFSDQAGAHSVKADNVIVAMGACGDVSLADRLRADGFVVEVAGDCTGIGYIEGAIRGGATTAAALSA